MDARRIVCYSRVESMSLRIELAAQHQRRPSPEGKRDVPFEPLIRLLPLVDLTAISESISVRKGKAHLFADPLVLLVCDRCFLFHFCITFEIVELTGELT